MSEIRSLNVRRAQSVASALLLSICVALTVATSAGAASADLDPTFGSGGIAKNAFGLNPGSDSGNAVAVQTDGKIVVVGSSQDPNDYSKNQFVFSRYLENGALDSTFGIGGQAAVSFGSDEATALDIAIQPDGKILAVGYASAGSAYSMAVTRINSNGTLDSGFRGGGKFLIDVTDNTDDDGKGIALAPDGTFYVVGSGNFAPDDKDFMVLKFKANGDNDLSFSGDGLRLTHFGVGEDGANAAVVQPDGKVVVVGYADAGAKDNFAVARYLTNGSLDPDFAGGAYTTISVGTVYDEATGVALTPDGKIVIGGNSGTGSGNAWAAVRLTSAGLPDATFDNDGKASFKIGTDDRVWGLIVRRDGKVVMAGNIMLSGVNDPALVQFNSNGSVDLGFGVGGYVRTHIGTNGDYFGVAEAPDGKIATTGGSEGDTIVARYLGEYVAPQPPAPAVALKTKFSTKLKSKMKAKDLKSIAGTAVGTGLAKVQVSINLADKRLLKDKKKCRFVKNSTGATRTYKAKKKKCAPAKWLTATGTTSWKYKLKGKLKPGKYKIYVRAIGTGGSTQTTFTKARGNLKAVTITK